MTFEPHRSDRRRLASVRRWLVVIACAVTIAGRGARGQDGRALTVDDVLRLEEFDAVVPSPDGRYLAVEVARPKTEPVRIHTDVLDSRTRRDIWIVRLRDGEKYQLTHGGPTSSGWFDPVWSPDGTRLAMLSTEGCACVRAWIWRLGDRAPHLVSPHNVDFLVFVGTAGLAADVQPLVWLSRTTMLVPLLPDGGRAHVDLVAEAESVTIAGWRAQRAGKESTASALESNPGQVQRYLRHESLVIADVKAHTTRVLATIPRDPSTSGRRAIVVSPNHRLIAVLTSRLEAPRADERLTRTMSLYALGLVDVRGRDSVRWITDVKSSGATGEDMPVPAWMPNGDALVVRGKWYTDGRWQPGLWRIDARAESIASLACADRIPDCSVEQAASAERVTTVVTDTGLYRVARDGHLVDALPASLRQPALELHQLGTSADVVGSPCIVATLEDADGHTMAFRLNVSSNTVSARFAGVRPPNYRIEGCMPLSDGLILRRPDRALAKLEAGRLGTLFEINAWSDSIADPRKVLVRYRSASGDSLGAVLVLPATRPDRANGPYPLVVWVYAGSTFGDTADVRDDRAWASQYNLSLLTAQGYAVLYPSIPLRPPGGEGGAVAPHLIGAVLPAIDRVGSLGVVDTSRVAVMGQSFGGWTTLALITRTHRFRSAIAMAAASDQISYSGTFRAWDRPWPYAHTVMAPPKMLEAGQQRLGGPFWRDPEAYVEDSPVFQASRVETPTMIIQGDQDPQGIQQAEEFFTALHRQGKRAEFVRYVGDGHVIESPANIRDMWTRIAAWLRETLRGAPVHNSVQGAGDTEHRLSRRQLRCRVEPSGSTRVSDAARAAQDGPASRRGRPVGNIVPRGHCA